MKQTSNKNSEINKVSGYSLFFRCAKYDNQVSCILVHNPRGSSFSFAELYPAGSDADDLSRNIQNKFVLSPKFVS